MSDYAYDEGYRAGMQKMREVGQRRIDELEAKLAKALDALGGMVGLFSVDNLLRKGTHLNMELDHARTTLAELSKEHSDDKGEW